jgi:hypothetical protein
MSDNYYPPQYSAEIRGYKPYNNTTIPMPTATGVTPSDFNSAKNSSTKENTFGIPGYVGLGTMLAGGILGMTRGSEGPGKFDYDPARRALGRYTELTDMNSKYWQNMKRYQTQIASEGSATINTLTGFAKAGGMSEQGASSLGFNQARANEGRIREGVSKGIFAQFLATEGQAQGYLGMESDRAKTEIGLQEQDRQRRMNERGDAGGDLFKTGASLLSMFI